MAATHHFRTDSSLDAADQRPPISVRALRETLGISGERMGRLLDVGARTIQRWEDNDQLPSNRWVRAVPVDLDKILDLGKEVFTPEGVQVVMTQPQPRFDGKSGLEIMEAGHSSDVYGLFALTYEGGLGS